MLPSWLGPVCGRTKMEEAESFGSTECYFQMITLTYKTVNYYSCKKMAFKDGIDIELFFKLNPILDPDCEDIKPYTQYCIAGCKALSSHYATLAGSDIDDSWLSNQNEPLTVTVAPSTPTLLVWEQARRAATRRLGPAVTQSMSTRRP